MMRAFRSFIAACLILTASNAAFAQDRPLVVAVNYPLQYFAERLLDDSADVVFPVPQDVDPSFWRPSIADISMIQSADLILLNGAAFATWVDRVSLPRSKLVNTSSAIEDQFIVTETITHSHGDGGEHSHEGIANYTWLDPSLAIAQAEAIARAIASRGLAPSDVVESRLEALRNDLEALDAQARSTLEDFRDVALIATHPRYQYFARRYDLSIASLQWEPGAMPTKAAFTDLQSLVDTSGANVLLWEAEPPAAAIEVAAQMGLQSIVFAPLAHGIDGRSFEGALADVLIQIANTADK